jgi:hypothetical protein
MRRSGLPRVVAAACGLAAALVIACARDAAPPAECRADADCVPATCCHPKACVPRRAAPDCAGVACTMHCEPGTLDCGGGCECRDERCAARLGSVPPGRDSLPAR